MTAAVRRRGRLLLAALAGCLLSGIVGTPAAAATRSPVPAPDLVIFAVPGLRWSDAQMMPELLDLARRGSVGQLSTRTSGVVSHCLAGALAVSAGGRTSAPFRSCQPPKTTWADLVQINRSTRFATRLGALGSALHRAGIPTTAVGDVAVPLVADASGHATRVVPGIAAAMRTPGVVAILDRRLYRAEDPLRWQAAALVDVRLHSVVTRLAPSTSLMVVGISDGATGTAHLHPLFLSGPGWPPGGLTSLPSGRLRISEIADLAPTILDHLGVPIPSRMMGTTIRVAGAADSFADYADEDDHAIAARGLNLLGLLQWVTVALLVLLLAAWRWHRPALDTAARWLGRFLAPAPAIASLANALPWWHWGRGAYLGIVAAMSALVALAIGQVAQRRRRAALLMPVTLTLAVLVADQFAGGPLQLSSPIGYSPLVAGRFFGAGNLAFAMIATSALLVGCVAAGGRRRAVAALICVPVLLLAIVVDAAPPFGADYGGLFTLLPASIVGVVLVLRARLSVARFVGAAVATILVAVAVAVADYSRPTSDQTHIGRFVGQVLHGGAWSEVHRKYDASVHSIGLTLTTLVVALALVVLYVSRDRLRHAARSMPGLSAGLTGVAVVAVVGSALNDSGIVVAAMAVTVTAAAVTGSGVLGNRAAGPD